MKGHGTVQWTVSLGIVHKTVGVFVLSSCIFTRVSLQKSFILSFSSHSFDNMKSNFSLALAALTSIASALPAATKVRRANTTDGPVGYASMNGGYVTSIDLFEHVLT